MTRFLLVLLLLAGQARALDWWSRFPAADSLVLGKAFELSYGLQSETSLPGDLALPLPELPEAWLLMDADSATLVKDEPGERLARSIRVAVFSLDPDTLVVPGPFPLPDLRWPFQLNARLAPDAEPADLLDPMTMTRGWTWWLLRLWPLLLLYPAWLLWRRWRVGSASPDRPQERIVEPWERYQHEMSQLEAAGLVARGRVEEHFARLSLVLRGLIEDCLECPCRELSTQELKQIRPPAGIPAAEWAALLSMLEAHDWIKYARQWPDTARCEAETKRYRDWARSNGPGLMETWHSARRAEEPT